MLSIDCFRSVYEALSNEGVCDSPGGVEYQRVLQEWLDAGRPEASVFIRLRANAGPYGESVH